LPDHQHKILILNGPNLNMLGVREPELYGPKTMDSLALQCKEYAYELGCDVDFRQSNHEGEMVTIIHETRGVYDGLIINAGAYAHTSIALLDALRMLNIPIIEVHITNTQKREEFRRHSYVSEVAHGMVCGFGSHGYILAIDAMRALLKE
jgi:3-dehydroquinate dehydratase-2